MGLAILTYGTLMNGRSRNYILRQLQFKYVRNVYLEGFEMKHCVEGNFPVLFDHSGTSVRGEIWKFPNVNDETANAILALLDGIEGEGKLYKREKMRDTLYDLDVYVYVGIPETWKNIPVVDVVCDEHGLWVGGNV